MSIDGLITEYMDLSHIDLAINMKENEELNFETFHRTGGKIFFVNSLLAVYVLSYITGTFFALFSLP